jgi:hypothetical protein
MPPLKEDEVIALVTNLVGEKRGNVKSVAEKFFGTNRCNLSAQINGLAPLSSTVLTRLGLRRVRGQEGQYEFANGTLLSNVQDKV